MPWADKKTNRGLTFGKSLLYLWADSKSVLCNGLRGSVMAARNFHKVEDHVRLWRPQPILDLRCILQNKKFEGLPSPVQLQRR
jgi:hypothetical protein